MESRIIKFRAWDGERMIYQDQNTASCWHGMERFAQQLGAVRGRTPDVMQFTGCYGVGGVELFEGDVVKEKHNGYVAVIIFSQGEFWVEPVGRWLEDWNWVDDADRMEVIGNIFENPELVKPSE